MKKATLLLTIFAVLALSFQSYAQTANIMLFLDMNYKVSVGQFYPDSEYVDLAADFNDWGNPGDNLTDLGNGLYMIEYNGNFNVGDQFEFKFRINGDWGNAEFEGWGGNRMFEVTSEFDSVCFYYNDFVSNARLNAWFPFDWGPDDATGLTASGDVQGTVLQGDRFGNPDQSYYFDGNAYINYGTDLSRLDRDNEYTISVWVNLDEYYSMQNTILAERNNGDNYQLAVWEDGGVYFSYWNDTASEYAVHGPGGSINPGEWTHLAVVADGANLSLYVNGEYNHGDTIWSFITTNMSPLLIGTFDGANQMFKGHIDDIRFYNRALDQGEVQTLYNYKDYGSEPAPVDIPDWYPAPDPGFPRDTAWIRRVYNDNVPVIDGNIDPFWNNIEKRPIGNEITDIDDYFPLSGPGDLGAKYRAAYTDAGLYLLVEVEDDQIIVPHGGTTHDNDGIEVFYRRIVDGPEGLNDIEHQGIWTNEKDLWCGGSINSWQPNPGDYGDRRFSTAVDYPEVYEGFADGDPGRVNGLEFAQSHTGNGYLMEFFFPWQDVLSWDPVPSVGDRFGIDFFINDNDGDEDGSQYETRNHGMIWSSTSHNLRAWSNFTGVFELRDLPGNDLSLIGVQLPAEGHVCGLSDNESIFVTIYNGGTNAQDNYDLFYTLDDWATQQGVPVNLHIEPNDTVLFEITGIDLSAIAVYDLGFQLDLSGDEIGDNNTLEGFQIINTQIEVIDPVTGYMQDFEAGEAGWFVLGQNPSWELGFPMGNVIVYPASGSSSWMTGLGSSYNPHEQSWVESPCFDFSGLSNPMFEFKIWYSSDWNGSATLQYSLDQGGSWFPIGNHGDYLNWYSSITGNLWWTGQDLCWMGYETDWVTARHTLDGLGGAPIVKFRIAFGSDDSANPAYDGFAFDDIRIYEQPAVEAQLLNIDNPVNNTGLGSDEGVQVLVRNNGTDPVNDITIYYDVDGGSLVSETFTGDVLNPGEEKHYWPSPGADLSVEGQTYQIRAWVAVPGEDDRSNDTLFKSITHKPVINSFPYHIDFTGGEDFWTNERNYHEKTSWGLSSLNGPVINDPGNQAWETNPAAPVLFYELGRVEGPQFDLSSLSEPILEFRIWRDMPENLGGQAYVEYWTGEGEYQLLGTQGDKDNWYNRGDSSFSWWGASVDDGWVTVRHSLDGLGGNDTVRLRIAFQCGQNWENSHGLAFDDIQIYDRPAEEMAILEWLSPLPGPDLAPDETVSIRIHNNGSAAQTGFDVEYTIDGWITFVTETVGVTINPGDTYDFSFTLKADFSSPGSYACGARVLLGGDAFAENDEIGLNVSTSPLITAFPYWQDFEGEQYWTSSGENSSWELGTPAAGDISWAEWGENAWVTNLTGNHNQNEISWVESPYFDFSSMLDPEIWFKKWSSIHWNEGTQLQASTDSGITWQIVGDLGSGNNWYNNHIDALNFLPNNAGWSDWTGSWQETWNSLDTLAGEAVVKFRFLFATFDTDDTEGFGFDNISIWDNAYNAEPIELLYPVSGCGLSPVDSIVTRVKNIGKRTWDFDVPIFYQINGGPIIAEAISGVTIDPGTTFDYVFSTIADLSSPGEYEIIVWTELPNEGAPGNDTLTTIISNKEYINSFPYYQDFESAHSWSSGGNNSDWALGAPVGAVINHAASGSNAWVTNLEGNYAPDQRSWVEGPCFDFSGINDPVLEMKIWHHNDWSGGASIQFSSDNGASWQQLGGHWDEINWFRDDIPPLNEMGSNGTWIGLSNNWMTISHSLDGLGAHPDVRLRVIFATENWSNPLHEGFAFDDVKIYDKPVVDAHVRYIGGHESSCWSGDYLDVNYRNLGYDPFETFNVGYQINGGAPGFQSINMWTDPGQENNFGFNIPGAFDNIGVYKIKVWMDVPGDPNHANDTMYKTIVHQPQISDNSYFEDFEGDHYWFSRWDCCEEWFDVGGEYRPDFWGPGTPSGNVINGAASGDNAWTSNMKGIPFRQAAIVESPCFDLSSYTRPVIEFKMWRHMATDNMGVALQYSVDGGGSWKHIGATGDTVNWYNDSGEHIWVLDHFGNSAGWNNTQDSAWVTASHALDGLAGQSNVKLRFVMQSLDNWDMYEGFAFDDVHIYDLIADQDAAMTAIISPVHACEYLGGEQVTIQIENMGLSLMHDVGVYYQIDNETPESGIIADTIQPGQTYEYTFGTSVDLSVPGGHPIKTWVTLAGDPFHDNDTLINWYEGKSTVTGFPYLEDFEAGAGDWSAYGSYSSWALGTPAGPVINHAASGNNAWVTNLSGENNDDELAFVEGPCFDFSNLKVPVLELNIWRDMEDYDDGALILYSLDMGTTWETLGSNEDTDWYNAAAEPGQPGIAEHGYYEFWSDRSWDWNLVRHSLSFLAGQPTVRFKVLFASGIGNQTDGFAFDDFRIFDLSATANWDDSGMGVNVDGIADEDVWMAVPAHNLGIVREQVDGDWDLSGTWKSAWDKDNFYLLINVNDEFLFNHGPGSDPLANDGVEIFFDFIVRNGAGSWAYDNSWYTMSWDLGEMQGAYVWDEGIEFVSFTDTAEYNYEIKFPWNTILRDQNNPDNLLDVPLLNGTEFGFDIRVNDNDNGDWPEGRLSWAFAEEWDFSGSGTISLDGRPPTEYDLELLGLSSPIWPLCNTTTETVTVDIANLGIQPVGQYEILYEVILEPDGIIQSESQTIYDTIYPGDTISVVLDNPADLYHNDYVQTRTLAVEIILPQDEYVVNNADGYSMKIYGDFIQPDGWDYQSHCKLGLGARAATFGVAEDSQGNIWWVIFTKGLVKYDGSTWTVIDSLNSNLVDMDLLSVMVDDNDHIWMTHSRNGVSVFDGASWTNYNTENSGLPNNRVNNAFQAADGTYWFSAHTEGLAHFDGTDWTVYDASNSPLAGGRIRHVNQDASGNLWVACPWVGVFMFDGTDWTEHSTGTGSLIDDGVYHILIDDNDEVWAGSWGGVSHFNGTDWEFLTVDNSGLPANSVLSSCQDSYGNYWFATFNGGVARYDGSNWMVYNQENGLTTNMFQRGYVMEASDGSMWFPSNDGLAIKSFMPVEVFGVDVSHNSCGATAEGAISINALGINPLKYSIDGGTTLEDFNVFGGLTTGDYDVVITDLLTDTVYYGIVTVEEIPNSTLPYYDDFEADNGGWDSGGDNSSWEHGPPSAGEIGWAASGDGAWVTNLWGNYNDSELSWVESPCFDFSDANEPFIEMDIWYSFDDLNDGVVFQYSTDNGGSWTTAGENGEPEWFNHTGDSASRLVQEGINDYWTDHTWDWMHTQHNLFLLAGEPSVKFRFLFGSNEEDNYEGFAFDNIRIYDLKPLVVTQYYDSGISVDGSGDEPVWVAAPAIPLGNVHEAWDGDHDLSGTWKTSWDADNLYLFIEVTDEYLWTQPEWPHTELDGVELYFNIQNNENYQGLEGDDNQWYTMPYDLGELGGSYPPPDGIEFVSADNGSGYNYEIKLPWNVLLRNVNAPDQYLGVSPVNGTRIGFDLRVNDNDNESNREGYLTWAQAEEWNFNGTGIIELDGRSAITNDLKVIRAGEISDDFLCRPGDESVYIEFTNAGTDSITDFELFFELADRGSISEMITDTVINPGDTIRWILSQPVNFFSDQFGITIDYTARATMTGDELPYNDEYRNAVWVYGEFAQPEGWGYFSVCDFDVPYNARWTYGLAADSQDNIWIGNFRGGIAKYDGVSWTNFDTLNSGLPAMEVLSLMADRDDNIWVGFLRNGAAMFDGSNWTSFTPENSGLTTSRVHNILHASDGSWWFAMGWGGVARFDGSTWTQYNTSSGNLHDDNVFAIEQDTLGNIWIGTLSGGAAMFNGVDWTVYDAGNSTISDNSVFEIMVDADNNIWFGGWNGLHKFDGSNWEHFHSGNSPLPFNSVVSLFQDSHGIYWFGLYASGNEIETGGLMRYDGTNWILLNTEDGITVNKFFRADLAETSDGTLWIPSIEGIAYKTFKPIELFDVEIGHVTCAGNASGWIKIIAAGVNPLKYSIDGGATLEDFNEFTGLSAGDYDVIVTDLSDTIFYGMVTVSGGANYDIYPYLEDFEFGPGFWAAGGDNSSWSNAEPQAGEINHAVSGGSAMITNPWGEINPDELSWVETNCYNFSSMQQPALEMDIWYSFDDLNDGVVLQYSTDGGATYYVLGGLGEPGWYNTSGDTTSRLVNEGIVDYWSGHNWGWEHVQHDLYALAGEPSVRFRFLLGSDSDDNQEGFAFDRIRIFDEITTIGYDLSGIVIDGIGDDAIWAPVLELNNTFGWGEHDPDDLSATWKATWDDDNLYILVDVTDDILVNSIGTRNNDSWLNDNVEILMDLYNDKDGEGAWAPDNRQFRFVYDWPEADGQHGWVPDIEFAFTNKGNGYTLEVKLPWQSILQPSQIDIPILTGTEIGFEVLVSDNDNGMDTESVVSWAEAYYDNLDGAGTVMLDGRPPLLKDAAVLNLLSPGGSGPYCDYLADVIVQLTNKGEDPIYDFDIAFSLDSIEQAVEIITDTLWQGDTMDYVFSVQADLYSTEYRKVIRVEVYTLLAGDEIGYNNLKARNAVSFGDYTDQPGWTTISPCDIGISRSMNSVTEDYNGDIWVGTGGDGIARFNGTDWTIYDTTNSNVGVSNIGYIYADGLGNVWAGARLNQGLTKWDGSDWTVYNTSNSGIAGDNVEDVILKDGIYYIATPGGISLFDGTNWIQNLTEADGLISNDIYDLSFDTDGNLWIATSAGPSKWDGSTFTNYTNDEIGAADGSTWAIHAAKNGDIWVGTWTTGVFRFNGSEWTNYREENSDLSRNHSLGISEDPFGNIWILNFGTGADVFDGENFTHYGTEEGLAAQRFMKNMIVDSDGDLWFPGLRALVKKEYSLVDQNIDLVSGWNIFSSYMKPADPDILEILRPLLEAHLLVKAQDETGAAVDSIPGIDWVNNIGGLDNSQGYKIKLKAAAQLTVSGHPVELPVDIGLTEGWNIMGYPMDAAQDAMNALDSLIDRGSLVKVQDETGAAIENIPPMGWINGILNFEPGEGYKIKVNTDEISPFDETGLKSDIIKPDVPAPEFFRTGFRGNGTDHMNVYLVRPTLNGMFLEPGDEIAVYDGELCVGAAVVRSDLEYVPIAVSRDDPTTREIDGYTDGAVISFKVWDASHGVLNDKIELSFAEGYPEWFVEKGTTVLGLNVQAAYTGIGGYLEIETGLGDNYPNPFTAETTIEYAVAEETKVTLTVYDILGRKVRILVDEIKPAGRYKVSWDRVDDFNDYMKSGIYLYEMRAGEFYKVKQMSLNDK